jgi:formiminotetrahydrofolate cyclodeaminase
MDFMKQSCEDFVSVLASKEPVPGGGGAAAFAAAIGTALGNMVGSLTLGKKKYADVQDDIIALKAKADALQADFLALVAKDAEAFEPLAKAYGIPKDDPEREETMEAALKEACAVPFEIMRKCCEAIGLHEEFAAKGTRIAISDVGCGVAFCKAALVVASLNVFINTKLMKGRAYAEKINAEAEEMLDGYTKKADNIYTQVLARLR